MLQQGSLCSHTSPAGVSAPLPAQLTSASKVARLLPPCLCCPWSWRYRSLCEDPQPASLTPWMRLFWPASHPQQQQEARVKPEVCVQLGATIPNLLGGARGRLVPPHAAKAQPQVGQAKAPVPCTLSVSSSPFLTLPTHRHQDLQAAVQGLHVARLQGTASAGHQGLATQRPESSWGCSLMQTARPMFLPPGAVPGEVEGQEPTVLRARGQDWSVQRRARVLPISTGSSPQPSYPGFWEASCTCRPRVTLTVTLPPSLQPELGLYTHSASLASPCSSCVAPQTRASLSCWASVLVVVRADSSRSPRPPWAPGPCARCLEQLAHPEVRPNRRPQMARTGDALGYGRQSPLSAPWPCSAFPVSFPHASTKPASPSTP